MNDKRAESDVSADPQRVDSRATGGEDRPDAPDEAATTSTTRTPEYVGRVAGDDIGFAEETGAERRADASSTNSGGDEGSRSDG